MKCELGQDTENRYWKNKRKLNESMIIIYNINVHCNLWDKDKLQRLFMSLLKKFT